MSESQKKLFGIIGYPLGHSLSPTLHEYIMKKIGLEGSYHTFEVQENELDAAIQRLKSLGFTGFNVTIPHKQMIVSYLDEITQEAQWMGAVNTVLIKNEKLYGYNTDGIGFIHALINSNIEIKDKSVVVLGAGGVARAVVYSLICKRLKKLWVLNRTPYRAELLAKEASKRTGFSYINFGRLNEETITKAGQSADLLINATSVGMWPNIDATVFSFNSITPEFTVIDLVYNPIETKFLRKAHIAGAETIDGLDMLIFQGIGAMKIWSGMTITFETFFKELKLHLIRKLDEYGTH